MSGLGNKLIGKYSGMVESDRKEVEGVLVLTSKYAFYVIRHDDMHFILFGMTICILYYSA